MTDLSYTAMAHFTELILHKIHKPLWKIYPQVFHKGSKYSGYVHVLLIGPILSNSGWKFTSPVMPVYNILV